MPGENVHDAADRVRAVQGRPLRSPDDLDVIDDVRIELRDEQWIRDLDSVHVNLGRGRAKGARSADATVLGDESGRRLLPRPHARDGRIEQLRQRAQGLTTHLFAVDDLETDGERTTGRGHRISGDDHSVEHTDPARGDRRLVGRRPCWREHHATRDEEGLHPRVPQQTAENGAKGRAVHRNAHSAVDREKIRRVRELNAGGGSEAVERVAERDVPHSQAHTRIEWRAPSRGRSGHGHVVVTGVLCCGGHSKRAGDHEGQRRAAESRNGAHELTFNDIAGAAATPSPR